KPPTVHRDAQTLAALALPRALGTGLGSGCVALADRVDQFLPGGDKSDAAGRQTLEQAFTYQSIGDLGVYLRVVGVPLRGRVQGAVRQLGYAFQGCSLRFGKVFYPHGPWPIRECSDR